jgi:hypothetical protein
MSSGLHSSEIDMRNFSNMSRYTMPVIVQSAEQKGMNTFCLDKAQNTFNF